MRVNLEDLRGVTAMAFDHKRERVWEKVSENKRIWTQFYSQWIRAIRVSSIK